MCLVLLCAGVSSAQPFGITFHRVRDEASSIVLTGEVANDGHRDVVDVWVTAAALSVTSALSGGGPPATFTVKLPRAEAVDSFRLGVSSFRYAYGEQSP